MIVKSTFVKDNCELLSPLYILNIPNGTNKKMTDMDEKSNCVIWQAGLMSSSALEVENSLISKEANRLNQ